MSTKLRALLTSPSGDKYVGRAVKITISNAFNLQQLPWESNFQFFLRVRSILAAAYNKWTLQLFREPRNLRQEKSRYQARIRKGIRNKMRVEPLRERRFLDRDANMIRQNPFDLIEEVDLALDDQGGL